MVDWFWLGHALASIAAMSPHARDQRPPQGVPQPRHRPHVIGQLRDLIAEGLDLGLGRRIGHGEPAYRAIPIAQTDCRKPQLY